MPAVLALAAVAACTNPRPHLDQSRLERLAEAFEVRAGDPARAAEAFAAAGSGTVLERVREKAWLEQLESTPSPPAAWQLLLDQRPPPAIEVPARIGLARALAAAGRSDSAVAVLEAVVGVGKAQADAVLVEVATGPSRQAAGRRLAVAAPSALHHLDPDLEAAVLPHLGDDERLRRAERWREAGQPSRALAELRRVRFRGEAERRRRLEMAQSEIAAGSPRRALGTLGAAARGDGEALVLRAAALRRLAWQRVPRSSASGAFRECLAAARRAAAAGNAEADELVLECGTESGSLREALAAWRRLEAGGGFRGDRRQWLGRRLGVALAQGGEALDAVRGLAAALPGQRRCLEFWYASAEGEGGRAQLAELGRAPIADLYGQWARRAVGGGPPRELSLPPGLAASPPPASVQWLLDRDATAEAADQWRWIADARGALPGEALSASELASRSGRQQAAISWLLRGFPDLGTVAMGGVPENVVRAYLPLKWRAELAAAAAENGIPPWLLAGVARQESTFVPHARSPRGALGVLQLLPGTARGHARALGLGRPDLFDPQTNLRLGARELARLLERFGAVEPALAAYNAGEARVARWWRAWPDRGRFTEAIPIPETYNYVRRVTYLAEAYRLVYERDWRAEP